MDTIQTARMQQLMEEVDQLSDGRSRELAQACISEVLVFHGNGLQRILQLLTDDGGEVATRILNRMLDDPFLNGLLLIHELHPFDLETRLNLALERVRPYIHSHGGSVELVGLGEETATIKLSGSDKKSPDTSASLEGALRQSIEEHCPDLATINLSE
jgi:Fe-S cluster biogenesis protein NfuA